MDDRQKHLADWAAVQLAQYSGPTHWECVAGDASSRRYFRLRIGEHSWMCVDSPPQTEKNAEFLQVRALLESRGVCVPALLAADTQSGLLLLGDLGDRLLLDQLDASTVDDFYRQALGILRSIYTQAPKKGQLPIYSREVLGEELQRFPQWFCQALLNYPLDAEESAIFDRCGELLIDCALEQPQVFVHRDFHSRNLLLQADGALGVIDFQDALVGAVSYDVVSLLKDCYIRWPRPQVQALLEEHRLALVKAGMEGLPDAAEFQRWFDWMGLQRHLKVLGTFARLFLRDGKAAYLQDLPLVLRYVDESLGMYTEFGELQALFRQCLDPLISKQDWSQQS